MIQNINVFNTYINLVYYVFENPIWPILENISVGVGLSIVLLTNWVIAKFVCNAFLTFFLATKNSCNLAYVFNTSQNKSKLMTCCDEIYYSYFKPPSKILMHWKHSICWIRNKTKTSKSVWSHSSSPKSYTQKYKILWHNSLFKWARYTSIDRIMP